MSSDTVLIRASHPVPQRMACPKHGEHDAVMTVKVYEKGEPIDESNLGFTARFGARPIKTERHYCMECYIEALDALDISKMEPIAGNPETT